MATILGEMDLDMLSDHKISVAVFMVTYNHEDYIEQAIKSVLNQETSFKFHLFIGEDCSTDNTLNICQKYARTYPDRITLFSNEYNIGAIQNAQKIYKACCESNAKYIAMLEGDDYWTHPHKLQKQVDFLESNSDYAICSHVVMYKNDIDSSSGNFPLIERDTVYWLEDYIKSNLTGTCSLLFRKSALKNIELLQKTLFGDWMLVLLVMQNSNKKMYVFKESMGVYRIHHSGIHGKFSMTSNGFYLIYERELVFHNFIHSMFFKNSEYALVSYLKYITILEHLKRHIPKNRAYYILKIYYDLRIFFIKFFVKLNKRKL